MHKSESTTAVEKGPFPRSIRQILAESRGFTLIELVLVIILLGVISVSVLPKFLDTSGVSLLGATAMVTADIRYAQELAMSTNQAKDVVFTPPNPYYTVASKTVNLPSNVSILSGETFTFNSLGEPTAGGGSYVEIQAGSDCKKICVENDTGNVSVVYPCTDPCP